MKISLNWIKEFVAIDAKPSEIADRLTLSGTEIEGLSHSTIPKEVLCCRVVKVSPHPNADRLKLCMVDTGKEEVQVVCGAPNVREGMLTTYIPVGVKLNESFIVSKAKIRGVESFGVLASEKELGLTDDHTGIMEIETPLSPGMSLADELGLEDWVLDVNVTPNRGDLLSVLGVSRELATLFSVNLKYPSLKVKEENTAVEKMLSVDIPAKDACPRYCARVLTDINIKKSPFWMRRRLFLSGVRAINNVVDITNYVMLEFGQPLHAFDYDRISDAKIVVRKANKGEKFITLDSVERELSEEDLLICDGKKPVALAGVMGGQNSEMSDTSKRVCLESAYFDPLHIRKTSRYLNLSTEASYRFERGVDPEIQKKAADRAASLMVQLSDARALKGAIDVNHLGHKPRKIMLRKKRIEQVLGLSVKGSRVESIFKGLGFDIAKNDGGWMVEAPLFRHDIEREIDLIEEYSRIDGMENIVASLPKFAPQPDSSEYLRLRNMRTKMSAMGFNEIINYSFISPTWKTWFEKMGLNLKNPISDEMNVMRTSLIPGLASVMAKNKRVQIKDISLFEIGRCFIPKGEDKFPEEIERLGIAISGSRRMLHWSEPQAQVDFYDLKGTVETLISGAEFKSSSHPFLAPGMQADIFVGKICVGYLGVLHPEILKNLDLSDEIFVSEILSDQLFVKEAKEPKQLAKFPSTWRDLSLVVDNHVPYERIKEAILSEGIVDLRQIEVVDLYHGEKLPQDKKGITLRITYQSFEKTLEDKVIDKWQELIIQTLEKLGIRLRQI